MRAKGEGTIEKVKTKAGYRFRIVAQRDGKRVVGPLRLNRAEAIRAFREKVASIKPTAEQPLSTFVAANLIHPSFTSLSQTTQALHRANANGRILNSWIADVPISSIDDDLVREWLSEQTGAPATVFNALDSLKKFLKFAGVKVDVVAQRKRLADPWILTESEQAELLALPMSAVQLLIVELGLFAGLRRSEIAGLRHEHREEDGIRVVQALVTADGQNYLKSPKTASSRQWVPLTRHLQGKLGNGKRGFVLTDSEEPLPPRLVARLFKSAIAGTKFEKLGMHDLRSTCGMRLLESGVDVRTASEMLRHDPAMLLKVYTKSRKDLKREALKAAFG